jgi:hypothetical protein
MVTRTDIINILLDHKDNPDGREGKRNAVIGYLILLGVPDDEVEKILLDLESYVEY